jgi:hypothetical protein
MGLPYCAIYFIIIKRKKRKSYRKGKTKPVQVRHEKRHATSIQE